MKILKISGRNLASLAGEFCVDFEQEPLASSGLFAISGPTGAGKSTLLDALCLALYDATPRLLRITRAGSLMPDVGTETVSAQDPRTLLRRGAAEAHAEVDFVGNDQLRYRARWSVRRARSKAAGGLQKSSMTLHRLPGLAALGGTKTEVMLEIAQRIGLSFEQFTRAVLLAQNEFSAFLKTDENERGELLETLTGSAVYSAISKRAFERYKTEQAAMQQLAARLADQVPLAAEARAALEGRSGAADAALAALDRRRAALEQHLRWHQEADKLRLGEAQAQEALAQALAQVDAAGGRRRQLATVDAVQPARQLVADVARLDAEEANLRAALAALAVELERSVAAQQQAALGLAAAGERLQAAEQAQRACAPQLDQAKALDASIAALAPSHAQAFDALDAARREAEAAREARLAKAGQLAATHEALGLGAAWLDAHRDSHALAAQWPRWDKLFEQAERAASEGERLAAALAQAREGALRAGAAEAAAGAALDASGQQLQTLEAARQQSIAALAAFDADALRAQRQAIDLRRDSLAGLEKTWTEVAATASRLEQARAQAAQLESGLAGARTLLAAAAADADRLGAAAGQAERSLGGAELACAGSVEDLRATLSDSEPCPVCGSGDHPYQHQNERLRAVLAGLRAEVARCRAEFEQNLLLQARQRAVIEAGERQLDGIQRDCTAFDEAIARLAGAWQAHPLAAEAPPPPGRGAWFGAQQDALRAQSRRLDQDEQAARAAAVARDQAQHACDRQAGEHAARQQAASTARAALAELGARHAALEEKHAQAAGGLAALLAELDAALSNCSTASIDNPVQSRAGGWQADWRRDPAPFRAARAAEASRWNEQSALQERRQGSLGALEAEQTGACARHERAAQALVALEAEFARIDADVSAKQLARQALWDGKPVAEIELGLAAAIAHAQALLAGQQGAGQQAALAETRARDALAHADVRIGATRAAALAAARRLSSWIEAFGAANPALGPIADAAQLAELLGRDGAAIAHERSTLGALDAAASGAGAVLAERRARHAQHLESAHHAHQLQDAGHDGPQDAAALGAALGALQEQRQAAHQDATALRLQLAQDEVRVQHAQAMQEEISRQEQALDRWGKMSDLIGSADGKKFRNYAQQFTLDVLLGYANSHLAQLARRYRLERVANAAGPSLALMVRDQDMGGEVRSVNSLSGGESFLVSLALALGLASLSSNRVRVESLFIDEGFGSLDSETLRVAMDALDGLQSMGRKVGVISHVQEMTERIATRIVVQPSGGGTSTVSVQ